MPKKDKTKCDDWFIQSQKGALNGFFSFSSNVDVNERTRAMAGKILNVDVSY